jgi:hypothetical protein
MNSSMIYCTNFCKCHNVRPPNTTIKKRILIKLGEKRTMLAVSQYLTSNYTISHSNKNNIVLEQKQTCKSMECNRRPRNKPTQLQPFDFRQRCPKHTLEKKAVTSINGVWVWTKGLHLEPLHQPFFVLGFSR